MTKKEIFIYYCSPEHWFQTALELNEAIKELTLLKDKSCFYENYNINEEPAQKSFCSKAVYLLMTFALENIIKGILVLRQPNYVNSGKLNKEIKTHELISLIELAQFEISPEERKLLEKLTHIGLSTARYPIGLNENHEIQSVNLMNDDEIIYIKLFKKLRNLLAKEFHENGWDSGSNNPELNTMPQKFNFKSFDD